MTGARRRSDEARRHVGSSAARAARHKTTENKKNDQCTAVFIFKIDFIKDISTYISTYILSDVFISLFTFGAPPWRGVRTEQIIPDGFEGDLKLRNTGGLRMEVLRCVGSSEVTPKIWIVLEQRIRFFVRDGDRFEAFKLKECRVHRFQRELIADFKD